MNNDYHRQALFQRVYKRDTGLSELETSTPTVKCAAERCWCRMKSYCSEMGHAVDEKG